MNKPLIGKILFTGTIECVTGLHIGASKDSLAIGSVDSPVVRDPISRQPYIPGSSTKGKLRSLLEQAEGLPYNRHGGSEIYRHECDGKTDCPVCRLYGSTGRNGGSNMPARLSVRDSFLTKPSVQELEKIDTGLQYTEWKFENGLDRITAAANPRQLERVPAGAKFEFEIVYDVETPQSSVGRKEVKEDVNNLLSSLSLLEDDALGGNGSRGSGKIRFCFDKIAGRKKDYYGAQDGQERKSASKEIAVKTIAGCRGEVTEILALLFPKNGGETSEGSSNHDNTSSYRWARKYLKSLGICGRGQTLLRRLRG